MGISTNDLLDFWSKAAPNLQVHPDDEAALKSNRHDFELDTLVGPWMGPISTAPVILLMLNPGSSTDEAARAAKLQSARDSMTRNLGGDAPLPNWEGNPSGRVWTTKRLEQFGISYKTAADKVAFINLMPYRSRNGSDDKRMINRLASSRIMLAWMRDTVFKKAETGERIVVCMRSHSEWGLQRGTSRGVSLFAPNCNRSGFIQLNEREPIAKAVRQAVFGASK